jgi:hypothetical protein
MNREHIAGFLMGISVGTAIGFFLRPPENHRREIHLAGTPSGTNKALDPQIGIRHQPTEPVASVPS